MSENIFVIKEDPQTAAMIMSAMEGETSIEFLIHDKVVVGMYEDGSLYVHGRLVENDKELFEGMRQWLKQANELNK
jgi:hypothetical protein